MVIQITKREAKTPLGLLLVTISKVEYKKSRNDHNYVEFSLVVVDAPNREDINRTINFQNFYLNSQFGMNRFLEFVGAATETDIEDNANFRFETEAQFTEWLQPLLQQRVTVFLEEREYPKSDGTVGKSTEIKKCWPAEQYAEEVNRVF